MKHFLLLMMMITPFLFFGQSVTLSKSFDVKIGKLKPEIDGDNLYVEDDGNIAIIKNNKDEITLEYYNLGNGKLIKSKTFSDWDKKEEIYKLVKMNDNFILFTTYLSRKEKFTNLQARKINFNDLTIGEPIVIDKEECNGYYRSFDRITLSEDNSKIVSFVSNADYTKFSFEVYNSNMELLWKNAIKDLPLNSDKIQLSNYAVNNDGVVYATIKVYNGAPPKERNLPETRHHYDLYKISEDGYSKTLINKVSPNVDELRITISDDNTKYLVGLYCNNLKQSNREFEGYYVAIVDNEEYVVSEKKQLFSIDIINKYQSSSTQKKNIKRKAKKKLVFKNYILRKTYVGEDGNLLLIGELLFNRSVSTEYSNTTTYYFNDIVIHKISKEGDLLWESKIPKSQAGQYTKTFSFKFNQIDGVNYFFFFDNKANKTIVEDNKRPKTYKVSLKSAFTVGIVDDNNGKVTKEFLFYTKDINGYKLSKLNMNRILTLENGIAMEASTGSDDIIIYMRVKE